MTIFCRSRRRLSVPWSCCWCRPRCVRCGAWPTAPKRSPRQLPDLADLAERAAESGRARQAEYDRPEPEVGPALDEVGQLAREFRVMAAALAEREQRLRRSEQLAAVGKMAAQITHEVRNPLTAIGLNAELLADEFSERDGEAPEAGPGHRQRGRSADPDHRAVPALCPLARPRGSAHRPQRSLRSLVQFAGEDLRLRGIRVELELEPTLPPLPIDEGQIRQAVLNLIRNASEAMQQAASTESDPESSERPRRSLLVRSRWLRPEGSTSPRIGIDIIDGGPGISAENQGQIFEPFFHHQARWHGPGLALALEIVTRHGGQLQVESPVWPLSPQPPTYGTRFTVELPSATFPVKLRRMATLYLTEICQLLTMAGPDAVEPRARGAMLRCRSGQKPRWVRSAMAAS